jgi:uncharacterized protein (DUF58 family)
MRLLDSLRRRLRRRTARWVRRRQGDDRLPVTIAQRRVYILPTRAGLGFSALLFVMLLAGLNYANGLALLLTFTLGGVVLVAMHQCHRNLLGTEVLRLQGENAFAGEHARLECVLGNPSRVARHALRVALDDHPGALVDLEASGRAMLSLRLAVAKRGRLRIERVRLDTRFPFGLFGAWTWLHLPLEILVYPAPRGGRLPPERAGSEAGNRSLLGPGMDEWSSLRPFRAGDSPRQVAWKAYARGAPLLVKEYQSAGAAERSFDYDQLVGLAPDARLEQLCRWVIDAEERGERYTLRLPGFVLAPGSGVAQREQSLRALALFGER